MPCYRCGARQIDPRRGPSPWKRGVRAGALVLVCPGCQHGRDWTADLDRCVACGSTLLLRALGETVCRACGREQPAEHACEVPAAAVAPAEPAFDPALSAEVAAAVERVLRRPW